jgi:ABC-2 type transport system ATP-binding protein
MKATIEVAGVRKRFGRVQALDGMTFTVSPGQVTGFVGPNGAGKSTTMRVILGLDAADAGTPLVGGKPYPKLSQPLSAVGSLLDAGALQPSRTARNHLLWLAHSQGFSAKRVDEVIAQSGLASAARRKAGGYSLGRSARLPRACGRSGNSLRIDQVIPWRGEPTVAVWSGCDGDGLEGVIGEHVGLGEGGAVLVGHRDGVAARGEWLVPVCAVGADLVKVDDPEPG